MRRREFASRAFAGVSCGLLAGCARLGADSTSETTQTDGEGGVDTTTSSRVTRETCLSSNPEVQYDLSVSNRGDESQTVKVTILDERLGEVYFSTQPEMKPGGLHIVEDIELEADKTFYDFHIKVKDGGFFGIQIAPDSKTLDARAFDVYLGRRGTIHYAEPPPINPTPALEMDRETFVEKLCDS